MKIIIGSDHRGYERKKFIKESFVDIEWVDVGTTNGDDLVDYPVVVKKLCRTFLQDDSIDRGILICGSGIGVSIAANRFHGIYAALCWAPEVAKVAREHDKSNILALSADFISENISLEIVKSWLNAEFAGGKYQKRLEMLEIK